MSHHFRKKVIGLKDKKCILNRRLLLKIESIHLILVYYILLIYMYLKLAVH